MKVFLITEQLLQSSQTPQDPTAAELESALPLSPPQSVSEHGKLHPSLIPRLPLNKQERARDIFAHGLLCRPGCH